MNKFIFHKRDCQCFFCKAKRKESHNLDCVCGQCKIIKGEGKEENNFNYKHGKYIKRKCPVCGKLLAPLAKTCAKHKSISLVTRKKISISSIKKFKNNPELRNNLRKSLEKTRLTPIFIEAYRRFKNGNKNKSELLLETLLNRLFLKEYKFVGNGEIWLSGFNPDFININGQKKIIEFFGDFWHANPEKYKENDVIHNKLRARDIWKKDKNRIEKFDNLGYKTSIIWENELKDIPKLTTKLLEFHNIDNRRTPSND
jgi:G:T-mismatch repair DNA endonuclease (very short patch repair protein)